MKLKDNSIFSIDIDDDLPEPYLQLKETSPVQSQKNIQYINSSALLSTIDSEKIYNIADPTSEFDKKHESILKSMLMFEMNESGVVNPSEEYFSQMLDENALFSMNLICKIFQEYVEADGRKVNLLVSILHMLSHFEYKQVFPIAQTIAMSVFNHKNAEVCEYAIKCFENWEHPDGIKKLSAIIFYADWLQEYANMVIKELEEIKENAVISQENITG